MVFRGQFDPRPDFAIFTLFSRGLSSCGSAAAARRAVKVGARRQLLEGNKPAPSACPCHPPPGPYPVGLGAGLCRFRVILQTIFGLQLAGRLMQPAESRGPEITFDGLPSSTGSSSLPPSPGALALEPRSRTLSILRHFPDDLCPVAPEVLHLGRSN